MNSGNLEETDVATKRDDPSYSQVTGYIPKAKALKFRHCLYSFANYPERRTE